MMRDARQQPAPNHIGFELPHFILETVVSFKLKRGPVWIAREHRKFACSEQVSKRRRGYRTWGGGTAFAADDDA